MNQLRTTDPEPVDVTSADGFQLPTSVVAVFMAVLILAAVGCHFISADSATTAALKVVTSTLALAVVPGALITLLWRVRPRLHVLELLGFGVALSFGVVHLLTIVAVSIHASPNSILIGLVLASFVMVVRAVRAPSITVISRGLHWGCRR